MAGFQVKVNFAPVKLRRALDEKFGIGSDVQKFIDTIVLDDIIRYMPYKTGAMIEGTIENTEIGSGVIKTVAPQARRLYYNPQYNFTKTNNPLAGAFWDKRAANDNKKAWVWKIRQRFFK